MNAEQRTYISVINRSNSDEILIKKTGWEEINLPGHAHAKFQIIYTLSGTLHVEVESENYFVPERHIAWIPQRMEHKLSSNSRQVSLVISIYNTNAIIAENLKFISKQGNSITKKQQPDLYDFTLSFLNLLPQMTPPSDILLKTLAIPNDSRLHPILDYITEHLQEELKMEQIAARYNLSVRNLSRLFNASGIHFSSYVNSC